MTRRALLAGTAALVLGGGSAPAVETIRITAKRFEFNPDTIRLRVARPAVLELVALDRTHGFRIPDLGVGAILGQGETVRVPITPERAGTFVFMCDQFCGDGHEDMTGILTVE
jgi:cytochrome c oxidase subunit 2